MKRILHYLDKILLVLGVGLFVASAMYFSRRFHEIDEIATRNPTAGIETAPYVIQMAQMPTIAKATWPEPPAQSRGPDWVYDVFTPPVIYFNPKTAQFTVTPPAIIEPVVVQTDAAFEVDLVSVRQEPYRIQLVGYAGDEGAFYGTFELADSGEIVVGRAGKEFPPEHGAFTLKSFEVRKVTTTSPDSMPVIENVGMAVILDARTGREETLTTRERKMLPRLQCVLRSRTLPPQEYTLREGMRVNVNGYDYIVVQLSLHPAQAVVSRRAPNALGAAETRTLIPISGTATSFPVDPGHFGGLKPVALSPNIAAVYPAVPLRPVQQFP